MLERHQMVIPSTVRLRSLKALGILRDPWIGYRGRSLHPWKMRAACAFRNAECIPEDLRREPSTPGRDVIVLSKLSLLRQPRKLRRTGGSDVPHDMMTECERRTLYKN